ncbi:MAG: DUF4872 domain-containing protein, partial [Candidatus Electrothrix sp. AR4]|nr:DUF4872 domain-containing protein [Candidatus Electrothrix sp. AR4]
AGRLVRWPKRLGKERAKLHLGHTVRMQEEIGTGGGGFRFMYAAFLQESAKELQSQTLADSAALFTEAGDRWRQFAVMAARVCKNRALPEDTYPAMAERIMSCADLEKEVFLKLRDWLKREAAV